VFTLLILLLFIWLVTGSRPNASVLWTVLIVLFVLWFVGFFASGPIVATWPGRWR
jgi:hypothetical protein